MKNFSIHDECQTQSAMVLELLWTVSSRRFQKMILKNVKHNVGKTAWISFTNTLIFWRILVATYRGIARQKPFGILICGWKVGRKWVVYVVEEGKLLCSERFRKIEQRVSKIWIITSRSIVRNCRVASGIVWRQMHYWWLKWFLLYPKRQVNEETGRGDTKCSISF